MEQARTQSSASWLATVFAFDLRSLALFRIALGLILIWDIAFRWTTLTEMYTRDGFFTQELNFEFFQAKAGPGWSSLVWSVYWLSDSPAFVTAMFAATAVLAAMLVAGYRTRIVTLALFVLTVSLQLRNPLVLTSGDLFLKTILAWSVFLPLGSLWSLDARRKGRTLENQPTQHVSVASMGLMCQLMIIYFCPGLAKLNEIWFSGDAMWYVLRLDIYITDFGRSLLEYPLLLKFVSWTTLFFEAIWILTLLVPWKNTFFRMSNMSVYWGFHIGIGLSMSIGLFPVICMIGWLPLVPRVFWDRRPLEAPARFLAWPELSTSGRFFRIAASLILFMTISWNIGNIDHPVARKFQPRVLATGMYALGLDQQFRMFDFPPKQNPWFVYDAELADGTRVNLLNGEPATYERPASIRTTFPSFHWRKFHRNMVSLETELLRQPLAEYWFKRWNDSHSEDKQIKRMRLILHMEDIGPDYNEKDRNSTVWATIQPEKPKSGSLFDSLKNRGDSSVPF